MALFYGKNWVGDLAAQATPPPAKLFRRKAKPPVMEPGVDQASDDDLAQATPPSPPAEIPNYQKRMAEDSGLAHGAFSDPNEMGRTATIADNATKPSLFGKGDTQVAMNETQTPDGSAPKKSGFFRNLGTAFIDQILPGFAKMQEPGYGQPTAQQEFEYYKNLPPDQQASYRDWETAKSTVINPLDVAKLNVTTQQNDIENARKAQEAQIDAELKKSQIEKNNERGWGDIIKDKVIGKTGSQAISRPRPFGATGIAPAPDGTRHYHDKNGNDLGPV